jgi:hypothetical protein
MKMKLSVFVMILVFIVIFCSCAKNDDKDMTKDNSKILVRIGDINITQADVDIDMTSTLSDKEILENLINDQLLLIKARELNISMSDKEVTTELNEMHKSMSVILPKDVKATKYDRAIFERFRNTFIIGKTRKKLGSDIEKELKQLREKTRIQYYN